MENKRSKLDEYVVIEDEDDSDEDSPQSREVEPSQSADTQTKHSLATLVSRNLIPGKERVNVFSGTQIYIQALKPKVTVSKRSKYTKDVISILCLEMKKDVGYCY